MRRGPELRPTEEFHIGINHLNNSVEEVIGSSTGSVTVKMPFFEDAHFVTLSLGTGRDRARVPRQLQVISHVLQPIATPKSGTRIYNHSYGGVIFDSTHRGLFVSELIGAQVRYPQVALADNIDKRTIIPVTEGSLPRVLSQSLRIVSKIEEYAIDKPGRGWIVDASGRTVVEVRKGQQTALQVEKEASFLLNRAIKSGNATDTPDEWGQKRIKVEYYSPEGAIQISQLRTWRGKIRETSIDFVGRKGFSKHFSTKEFFCNNQVQEPISQAQGEWLLHELRTLREREQHL